MQPERSEPEVSEVVVEEGAPQQTQGEGGSEGIHHPAKVMRIAAMARQLLEEVRGAPLDEASRARLADIYETSIKELSEVLSPELKEELSRLSLPFQAEAPSEAELRVAHSQLVGWLEGLFHGIQAMMFAQQVEARSRLEEMRRQSLPPGSSPLPEATPGQYL
ncbi:bacterial proteasome activator family protein [soil metagenome]